MACDILMVAFGILMGGSPKEVDRRDKCCALVPYVTVSLFCLVVWRDYGGVDDFRMDVVWC